MIDKKQSPYLNLAIINTLQAAYFSSPKAVGSRHLDDYKSSIPERNESEITASLVALASTAVGFLLVLDLILLTTLLGPRYY